MIHELHQSLFSETVFFDCFTMLNVKTENAIKKFEDFQEEKTDVSQLEIIHIFMN